MLASTMQFSSNDPSPAFSLSGCSEPGLQRGNTLAPSGPNSVPDPASHEVSSTPEGSTHTHNQPCRIVNVPPMSNHHRSFVDVVALDRRSDIPPRGLDAP
jgi:hypothetical protein